MGKVIKSLQGTKKIIEAFQGKELEIKVNLGRNKFHSYKGRITGCYQSIFCVSPSSRVISKTSFSYAEYICGQIKLKDVKEG